MFAGAGSVKIVRRHIDRLERGNRAFLGRSDALLKVAHFGGERRLITDGGWGSAKKRGHFGASLREAENVIDEEQHVLVIFIAEIFRHRQSGKSHAQTSARRLVHLAVHERDFGLGKIFSG